MKTLLIFGSTSDEHVYDKIKNAIDCDLFICSAHRTSELLDEILKNGYDIIIAGAGLAAHLPGVIASKVISPVIGIPVSGNYGGLDALLSIIQMPPQIPVLGTGIENTDAAIQTIKNIKNSISKINIIDSDIADPTRLEKMTNLLQKYQINFTISKKKEKNAINLLFKSLDAIQRNNQDKNDNDKNYITIHIPIKKASTPKDAIDLIKLTETGLWVGLNRYENAGIAAIQLLNITNNSKEKYTHQLKQEREDMKKKIYEINKLNRQKPN